MTFVSLKTPFWAGGGADPSPSWRPWPPGPENGGGKYGNKSHKTVYVSAIIVNIIHQAFDKILHLQHYTHTSLAQNHKTTYQNYHIYPFDE